MENNYLSERISELTGCNDKLSEKFIDAVSQAIAEELKEKGAALIDGLGTFKTVDMAQRESVNVNNGQRIIIPAYKKLAFSPKVSKTPSETPESDEVGNSEQSVAVNQENFESDEALKTEVPAVVYEGSNESILIEEDNTNLSESKQTEHEKTPSDDAMTVISEDDSEETVVVETPLDEFSGIDVLISTPESLDDMKLQLQDALTQSDDVDKKILDAENMILAAQQALENANKEKNQILERINRLSESIDNIEQKRKTLLSIPEKPENENTDANNVEDDVPETSNQNRSTFFTKNIWKWIAGVAAAAVLLIVVLTVAGSSSDENDKSKNADKEIVNSTTNKKTPEPKKQPQKPKQTIKKVTFDGYTPFEIIVINHYGDRKHMKEVLDYNVNNGVFKDWANIPVGTEILLPEFKD